MLAEDLAIVNNQFISLQSKDLQKSKTSTWMQHNPQAQGQLRQTFLLHPKLTLPIRSLHLSASPPRQLCSVPQWCYFC